MKNYIVPLVIIGLLVGGGLYYFKEYRYDKISDITVEGRYLLKANFLRWGSYFDEDEGDYFTLAIYGDGTGLAVVGEIRGTGTVDFGYVDLMVNNPELTEKTLIMEVEVTTLNPTVLKEDLSAPLNVDVGISILNYRAMSWWE